MIIIIYYLFVKLIYKNDLSYIDTTIIAYRGVYPI